MLASFLVVCQVFFDFVGAIPVFGMVKIWYLHLLDRHYSPEGSVLPSVWSSATGCVD